VYGGDEQVPVIRKAGEKRALSSILQNAIDAWMTYLGQRLRPINDYWAQLPVSSSGPARSRRW